VELVKVKKISRSHTHTHTDREQHPRHRHAHTRENNTPKPKTNTYHKHLTKLEGGATTVHATSHARVGGLADVSVRGKVEVRRGLGRARVLVEPVKVKETDVQGFVAQFF